MIANAFTVPRLCMLTGDIKPLSSLKATPRETQFFASSKSAREKLVLANNYNQIHITTQASSDESRPRAGRHIRG
jgi:hypothetical protein